MIDWQNFLDHPVNSDLRTYDNIHKITSGQGDDCTTDCLVEYAFFKKYYKMIAIDLSKQQALDADPKAIQQINVAGKIDWDGNTTLFLINEAVKETILDFSYGTFRVL